MSETSRHIEQWFTKWRERHGEDMNLATHPVSNDLHRWEGGVWRNITPRFGRVLRQEAEWTASNYRVAEVLAECTDRADYLNLRDGRYGLDSEAPRINFTNGVYDLASGELLAHGEPWATVNQIPWQYDADIEDYDLELATMPLDEYMRTRVAADTHEAGTLWQIIGGAMLPGNPSQTFVILSGPKGSGKGTFLDLLRDVIGDDNYSSLTLAQLDNRFSTIRLNDMLANVAGDVIGGVVPAYELILNITAGEAVDADRKHRDGFSFTWDGTLILATNGRLILPPGAGGEAGWWRRSLYLDMPNAVADGERVMPRVLRQRIAPDLNLIATRAARELREAWLNDGEVPTVTGSMVAARQQARTSGNTVDDWADDRLTPSERGEVNGTAAYDDYAIWCERYGHRPKGHRAFYADLANNLTRRGIGGRIEGRDTTSRALFYGVTMTGATIHKPW